MKLQRVGSLISDNNVSVINIVFRLNFNFVSRVFRVYELLVYVRNVQIASDNSLKTFMSSLLPEKSVR